MKHLLSTALLCGAGILAGQAQNVVITDKDGIAHRFHADYVQEITFEKIQAGDGYDLKFDEVSVNAYSKTNIGLTFMQGENTVSLDVYQPGEWYLQPGTYKVDGSNDGYTIDPGYYSTVIVNGNTEVLSSGDMIVSLNGDTYTFDMDFTLVSGQTLKGTYTGELSVFGPAINFDLTNCAYANVNEPASNGFYYNFNDANWKLEMRIELFSDGNAPAAGTYTFSDTMENGTASSYVNLYSPYNEVTKFTEGTVTVSGEGDDTEMVIEGTLGFGIKMKAVYKGALPARPSTVKEYEMTFDSIFVQSYGNRNETITLYTGENEVVLDFYQPDNNYFLPGTYTVNESNDDYTIDPFYSRVTIDGVTNKITSGTVTVALDDKVYTFEGTVEFEGGSLKLSYNGELPNFGPKDGPDVLEFDLIGVYYVSLNDPAENGFYYRFNDFNWSLEMRLDIFSAGDAPAAGTYTISDTMENGTASSNIDLYSPSLGNVKFTEGTVTISGEGDATVVEVEGKIAEDLILKAKYVGALPARPATN